MSTSDGSTKPLDVQIGGDHYKSMAIQPMEYSMANKLDACQHTIIKYVTRFRDKGGIQDLEKAKHCIDLLIHFERQAATVKESLTVHPVHPATFDHIDPADADIASSIDDESERMQAIGQNGEMGSEVYAAVDGAPSWDDSPKWANWLAQDEDGKWQWYSLKPTLDDESTEFSPQRNDQWWLADSDECTISADARSGWRSSLQPRHIK